MWILGPHHACVDGEPASILELFAGLSQKVGVGSIAELDVDPELVARLVVRANGHVLDVLGIHPVNVHVDYNLVSILAWYRS